MSMHRPLIFASFATLLVGLGAFATLPAGAEDPTGLLVSVQIDETLSRVSGTVVVTDLEGNPLDFALVQVASTVDAAPDLPPATASGATRASGAFDFAFGYASTGSLPGAHTLAVVVTRDGLEATTQVAYAVPDL